MLDVCVTFVCTGELLRLTVELCVLELLMLKRRIVLVPGIVFSARDIDDLMCDMCNDQC